MSESTSISINTDTPAWSLGRYKTIFDRDGEPAWDGTLRYGENRLYLDAEQDAVVVAAHLNRYERLLVALGTLDPRYGPNRATWLSGLLDNLELFYRERWAQMEDADAVREGLNEVRALCDGLLAVADEIGEELANASA